MLFKFDKDQGTLSPMKYMSFAQQEGLEKDLENLMARYLLGTLFEEEQLFPVHQSRNWQEEADLYALDARGDLSIFELKRSGATAGALSQALRYAQLAGSWSYEDLSRKHARYQKAHSKAPASDLAEAHQEAFRLDRKLEKAEFNREQHLWIVGSAADRDLVRGVDYWRRRGLDITLVPYRLYPIGQELIFEFFAHPYDQHSNPGDRKGVLFDTNRSYCQDANRVQTLVAMLEKRRISAYGDRKDAVRSLSPRDLVFYSHAGFGLVAAAEVIGPVKADGAEELYQDVRFLTKPPENPLAPAAMPFDEVKKVTGKSFFWARIQKVPYLDSEEAQHLLAALQKKLGSRD